MHHLLSTARGTGAVLLAAWLLAACRLGGNDVFITVTAGEVTPAEATPDSRGDLTVTAHFTITLQRDRDEDSARADSQPLEGLPAGVHLVGASPDGMVLSADSEGSIWPLRLTLRVDATAAPGRYRITVPVRVCETLRGDTSTIVPGNCPGASTSFTLVIPGPADPGDPTDPVEPATWQPVGAVLNLVPTSFSAGPALAADAAGLPVVAWVDQEVLTVRRWDGAAWQTLAGPDAPLTALPASGRPALAVDADGSVVVAWAERRSTGGAEAPRQLQVWRWSGTAWQSLSATPMEDPGALSAHDPALRLAGTQLLLAWSEQHADGDGGGRVQVRRLDGGGWVDAGASAVAAPGQPHQTQLATDDDGRLVVAWRNALDQRVRVHAAAAGAGWVQIGDFAAVNVARYALGHAPAQGLLIAIPASPPATQLQVRRFDGGGWSSIGSPQGPTQLQSFLSDVALAADAGGNALLGWALSSANVQQFEVRRWSGGDWAALGSPVPALARSAPGTPWGLALSGGAVPLLATETSTSLPVQDIALRIHTYR